MSDRTDERRHMTTNAGRQVSRWLTMAMYALQIAVVAVLLLLSIVFTPIFRMNGVEPGIANTTEYQDLHLGLPSLPFVLGVLLLGIGLMALSSGLAKMPPRRMLWALLSYVFVVQVLWIASLSFIGYEYQDSMSLADGARALLQGDVRQFAPEFCGPDATESVCVDRNIPNAYSYFSFYPFQSGSLLWYLLVFAVFGVNNVIAFQVISAIAITGLVAVLWRLAGFTGLNRFGQGAFCALTATCVPLLMFCAFVYPNAVGFFIVVAGTAVIAEGLRRRRIWSGALTIVVGVLICGIGIVFKSTYQIVLLGALLALAVVVITTRRYWQFLIAAFASIGAVALSKLPTSLVQHWVHQDFGRGMPMLSWISLGLGQPDVRPAGWWSIESIDAFNATHGDYDAQSEIARQLVGERLGAFLHHPAEGLRFFTAKLASQWAEPTFMTSYYSQLGESSVHYDGLAGFFVAGRGSMALIRFDNIAQTVMYAFAFIGVVALFRTVLNRDGKERDESIYARVLLGASFLGGFLCYVLWEAKGIYTLPFYVLLIPVAAHGAQSVHQAWSSYAGRHGSTRFNLRRRRGDRNAIHSS